ncbi:DUF4259 domain-containing protein [Burkholderia aenigmatica]|uniref:DUF4259 domain-containing protein n=1 Tax=Burkholderia aenigmatica TaxID=2015348 RepID=UPI001178372B|nr:DUF4259 domain-containing protein [Burkholderia aenigmatica]
MGAWGFEPWGNDESVSWFAKFIKSCNLTMVKDSFDNFNEADEVKYEQIRAACYILQFLAKPYIWQQDEKNGDAKKLLERGVEILGNMINPPNSKWTFLEMWDSEDGIIGSVESQIFELKKCLSEWKA